MDELLFKELPREMKLPTGKIEFDYFGDWLEKAKEFYNEWEKEIFEKTNRDGN